MLKIDKLSNRLKPLIAEEDIIAYKVMEITWPNYWQTPFRNFAMDLEQEYKAELKRNFFSGNVSEGFHAFQNYSNAASEAFSLYNEKRIAFYTGALWFSAVYDKQKFPERNFYVFKAIIPKGSEYYTGHWRFDPNIKTIASNRMIIKTIDGITYPLKCNA